MKNTSRSKNSRTAEERFVCENWDEPEAEVTPDSTVKCPKCGARFRVGRRIAA